MKTSTLGRTGLVVTQLSFGAAELRGPGAWNGTEVTEQQCEAILHAVLDAGINYIDTSPDYGRSEERIGRYIGSRRSEYYIASKCGCDLDHPDQHLWTPDTLWRNIESSLARLRTDHIELIQLHNASPEDVTANELVAALLKMKEQGLTRFIGVSTSTRDADAFLAMGVFDAFQLSYSCLEPHAHDLITMLSEAGSAVIIRGGIAKGGPDKHRQANDNRVMRPMRPDKPRRRPPLHVWEEARLHELLGDMKPTEFILRYTLSHPHCQTTIIGMIELEHLRENLASAQRGPLSEPLYNEARQRIEQVYTKWRNSFIA